MWWLTKCKIKKSISVLKQWIPDLKVSANEIGTIVQISIDYEILNVKRWNFLIIYNAKNQNNEDLVKVYFVLPNYQELSAVFGKGYLESLHFIKSDSYNNKYLAVRENEAYPYDAINIISSIIAALYVIEKYNSIDE